MKINLKKRHSPTCVCMLHYAFKFSLSITDILQPIKMKEEKKKCQLCSSLLLKSSRIKSLSQVPVLMRYKTLHFFFFGLAFGHRTARIASSKTFLRPFCVSAEHSRYLTALISLAIARPWGYVMGANLFSFSFSTVSLSSRRSSLVPTRMIGVLGQWWLTSGYHCKKTFRLIMHHTNSFSYNKFLSNMCFIKFLKK